MIRRAQEANWSLGEERLDLQGQEKFEQFSWTENEKENKKRKKSSGEIPPGEESKEG